MSRNSALLVAVEWLTDCDDLSRGQRAILDHFQHGDGRETVRTWMMDREVQHLLSSGFTPAKAHYLVGARFGVNRSTVFRRVQTLHRQPRQHPVGWLTGCVNPQADLARIEAEYEMESHRLRDNPDNWWL